MTNDLSEDEIIDQTLEALEAWAIEETKANPESGLTLRERYLENAETYLERLNAEIAEKAESIGKPISALEALQNYRRDLRYQFGLADNHFELINAYSCGTPEFQNVLQCVDYMNGIDKAIEQLGGKVD
jgi:hypothetical protein